MARRLARHSHLDLAGPARLFRIEVPDSPERPWTVSAPDAVRAVARHAILRDLDPACLAVLDDHGDPGTVRETAADLVAAARDAAA